jgi:hypothetical protein
VEQNRSFLFVPEKLWNTSVCSSSPKHFLFPFLFDLNMFLTSWFVSFRSSKCWAKLVYSASIQKNLGIRWFVSFRYRKMSRIKDSFQFDLEKNW